MVQYSSSCHGALCFNWFLRKVLYPPRGYDVKCGMKFFTKIIWSIKRSFWIIKELRQDLGNGELSIYFPIDINRLNIYKSIMFKVGTWQTRQLLSWVHVSWYFEGVSVKLRRQHQKFYRNQSIKFYLSKKSFPGKLSKLETKWKKKILNFLFLWIYKYSFFTQEPRELVPGIGMGEFFRIGGRALTY